MIIATLCHCHWCSYHSVVVATFLLTANDITVDVALAVAVVTSDVVDDVFSTDAAVAYHQ